LQHDRAHATTGGAEIAIRKQKAEEKKEKIPLGGSASSEDRSRAGACRVGVYGVRARDGIGSDWIQNFPASWTAWFLFIVVAMPAAGALRERECSCARAWTRRTVPSLVGLCSQHCAALTGGTRAYGPGLFGPLVSVAEPGSITQDQCRFRFQHEPGPIGLHVDALQRDAPWVNGPGS
jgi:hypothetical protein